MRRFPAERTLRHKLDEAAFLEFGKGTLGRFPCNVVASLKSAAIGRHRPDFLVEVQRIITPEQLAVCQFKLMR
jgi:hypothetical protein